MHRISNRDILVVAGGVIPPDDYDYLYKHGVADVFGPGLYTLHLGPHIPIYFPSPHFIIDVLLILGTRIPEAAMRVLNILLPNTKKAAHT